jgi:uncharacterized protein
MKNRVKSIKRLILLIGMFFPVCLVGQKADLSGTVKIKGIPYLLKTYNDPLKLTVTGDSIINITSKGKTNLFNNPNGIYYVQTAPMLLFHPDSNFIFRAKIRADLKEVYDVAALVIYQNNDLWAKLCFENSMNKEATVVSVVTRRYSDDCNSSKVNNNIVYLSIAKKGKEFSFHCSKDNKNWELIRHFRLESDDTDLKIGFTVHCSVGEQFSAVFSEINYSGGTLINMRKYQ